MLYIPENTQEMSQVYRSKVLECLCAHSNLELLNPDSEEHDVWLKAMEAAGRYYLSLVRNHS